MSSQAEHPLRADATRDEGRPAACDLAALPQPEPWPAETFEGLTLGDIERLIIDATLEIERRRHLIDRGRRNHMDGARRPQEVSL